MAPTCIVAARDHALARSLKRTLEPELEVVAMVDNVVSLSTAIEALHASLLVVDLGMLEADVSRVLQVLRDRSSCPPIVGLGAPDETDTTLRNLGLDAVVERSRAGRELVPVAREVLSRAGDTQQPKRHGP